MYSNYVQYQQCSGIYQHICVRLGERQNREVIRNFILSTYGVDLGDQNKYKLSFTDDFGNYYELDSSSTIRRAFEVARLTLNGQSSVCLSLWPRCDLKPTIKSEVKEENC